MIGRTGKTVLRHSRQQARPPRKVCPFCFEGDHIGGQNHIPHIEVEECQPHHVLLTEERLAAGAETKKQPHLIKTVEMAIRALAVIRITESHPKALLWLLHVAKVERPIAKVGIGHLRDLLESESQRLSAHERDPALGALAALAMLDKWSGWRDLSREEKNAFTPVSPVEYWMPVT